MNSVLLALLFAIVAFIYSSVGFGGGSSYSALLILAGVSYRFIPAISLACNIVVVSGNSLNYLRSGDFEKRLFLIPTIFSVPMAYFGGLLDVSKMVFMILLCGALLVTGLELLFGYRNYTDDGNYKKLSPLLGGAIGGVLGFLAGITGIGGGIFLAPILYKLRAGKPKQIAAAASLFILVNSISGLIGQLQKNAFNSQLLQFWYLPIAVMVFGQLGNRIAIKLMAQKYIALMTAILVLFVAIQLFIKIVK